MTCGSRDAHSLTSLVTDSPRPRGRIRAPPCGRESNWPVSADSAPSARGSALLHSMSRWRKSAARSPNDPQLVHLLTQKDRKSSRPPRARCNRPPQTKNLIGPHALLRRSLEYRFRRAAKAAALIMTKSCDTDQRSANRALTARLLAQPLAIIQIRKKACQVWKDLPCCAAPAGERIVSL